VLPYLEEKQKVEEKIEKWGNMYAPTDISYDNSKNNSIRKLDQNVCSIDCCKHTQWLPKELNEAKNKNLDMNYVGSNLTCNNGTGGGCICMKKEDIDMLQNKSGNSMPTCKS
jgi:hypothetical protein